MSNHSLADIYDLLNGGNSLTMKFYCRDDANSFRTKLGVYKYRTEKPLRDMGVIEPESLVMTYDNDTKIATFEFKKLDPQKEIFEILTISSCANTKQSGSN